MHPAKRTIGSVISLSIVNPRELGLESCDLGFKMRDFPFAYGVQLLKIEVRNLNFLPERSQFGPKGCLTPGGSQALNN